MVADFLKRQGCSAHAKTIFSAENTIPAPPLLPPHYPLTPTPLHPIESMNLHLPHPNTQLFHRNKYPLLSP